jgi:hypothetical protein
MQVGVDMFPPHTILPVQFHAARSGPPARRLMLAVLQDALDIHRKYAHESRARRGRLVAETDAWLFSDDTTWPFSFVNLCHGLGIDVASLRRRLVRAGSGRTRAGVRFASAAG